MGWQTACEWNLEARQGASDNYNHRDLVPADTSSYSGTKIRISIPAHATGDVVIYGASIGESTANDDMDNPENGTFKRITFDSGNDGCTISAGATKVSDEITFNFDKTKRYLICVYHNRENSLYNNTSAQHDGSYYGGPGVDGTVIQSVSYTYYDYYESPVSKLEVYEEEAPTRIPRIIMIT